MVEEEKQIFIIRPWHAQKASKYPHLMDGIEYVDSVIDALDKGLTGYDVAYDKKSFKAGLSIRENLTSCITDSEIIIAILDGLRPNVVFELGYAYAEPKNSLIICIIEEDATVLVRNYFEDPLVNETIHEDKTTTVRNPRLNLDKHFADIKDILHIYYSRLRLEDLVKKIKEAIESYDQKGDETKSEIVRNIPEDLSSQSSESNEVQPVSELFNSKSYDEIITKYSSSENSTVLKLVALSYMKTNRISQAIPVWTNLANIEETKGTAHFHLAICYYALNEFGDSLYHLTKVDGNYDQERVEDYKSRIIKKMFKQKE